MKLSRLSPDKSSLPPRERAADPKVLLRKLPTEPRVLPAPGSAEARIAFAAACREHGKRIQLVDSYLELKRTPLTWWTAASLEKAMERGDITPAEGAGLYPLAIERELCMAEIAHELQLGALHALAFADSYPLRYESSGLGWR